MIVQATLKFKIFLLLVLTSCQLKNTSKKQNEQSKINNDSFSFMYNDFKVFYNQFISDTIFQKSRIKFPLKGTYSDHSGDEKWKKQNWPYVNWHIESELKNNTEDSISIIQNKNSFFYGIYCLDCGFSFEMEFEKINGKWFLTYRQEDNF